MEGNPDRGEHHQVQQDAEQEGDQPHQQDYGHTRLARYQGPLLGFRSKRRPTLKADNVNAAQGAMQSFHINTKVELPVPFLGKYR
jgi:hypothetical protein